VEVGLAHEAGRRFWLLDATRREVLLISDAAFLLFFVIVWLLCGVVGYLYARWTMPI
jgi:hypothetical protein